MTRKGIQAHASSAAGGERQTGVPPYESKAASQEWSVLDGEAAA
jgi:hypothetical protein